MVSKGQVASRALWWSGIGPLALRRRQRWRGVLTLTYHRVRPDRPRYFADIWSATPPQFADHLDLVARTCDVVDLSAVSALHDAVGRHVAISFDDGYRDNYEYAFPLLRDRRMPATFFVATGILDGQAMPWWDELAWLHGGLSVQARDAWGTLDGVIDRYWRSTPPETRRLLRDLRQASTRAPLRGADIAPEWMTWEMVREMHAAGMSIQAHTVRHPLLGRLPAAEQYTEIATSVQRIEEEVGERPRALAYPVGTRAAFDVRSQDAARQAGIEHAFSIYGHTTSAAQDWDPLDAPRVGIGRNHDRALLGGLLAFPGIFGRPRDAAAPTRGSDDAPRSASAPSPGDRSTNGRLRPRRLRVVAMVDRLVEGGAERLAYQLTRDLDPERFAATLCVTRGDDVHHAQPGTEPARWKQDLLDRGINVVELDRSRRTGVGAWRPLIRELRRADIVHGHMFGSYVWSGVLGRLTGVPVVIGHEHAWAYTGGRLQPVIDRHLISRTNDALIAPAEIIRDRMIQQDGVAADRVVVLPNGIERRPATPEHDVRAELGIAPDALVVGSVGTLRAIKRFDVLVAAADRLRQAHPDVRVLIAGGGAERERLQQMVAARNLQDTVMLLGSRSDVPDLLRAFDVAVTCSDAEASPLSIMEYMEAGLPTVATAVGGIPELLTDGVHGRLVPRRDPDALARAISGLLEHPSARRRLGAAAQARRLQEFDLQVMVRRVEELYERLYAASARQR